MINLAAAKTKEGGESAKSHERKKVLYEQLLDWYSDFKAVAIIALRKTPQLREQLGWKEE